MIDYHSSDRSVEIIRSICPTWDIVPSRNTKFIGEVLGIEVQDLEESVSGWKVVLNVTEFIVHNDFKGYLKSFEKDHPEELGFWTPCFPMVDPPHLAYQGLDPHESLITQRHWGFYDMGVHNRCCRLIHKDIHGHFDHGRHASIKHRYVNAPCNETGFSEIRKVDKPYRFEKENHTLFICWYGGWSPFNPRQILRVWQKADQCVSNHHIKNYSDVEGFIQGNYHNFKNHTKDLYQLYPLFRTFCDDIDYVVEQPKREIVYDDPKTKLKFRIPITKNV